MHDIELNLREDIYQAYHPFILERLQRKAGNALQRKAITLDHERASFMFENKSVHHARVLDIGANQGYFTVEAALRGAGQVDAYESNAIDGDFLFRASQAFAELQSVRSLTLGYDFHVPNQGRWSDVICLNVLHHTGRYFDEGVDNMLDAKATMAKHLQGLLTGGASVWFQLGFNWKGDEKQPMFEHGTKREMTEYVDRLLAGRGRIAKIGIYNPCSEMYEQATFGDWAHPLWARVERLGEFANRPLYLIESTV